MLSSQKGFEHWKHIHDAAASMCQLIHKMSSERAIDIYLGGVSLSNCSATELIAYHQLEQKRVSDCLIHETWPILAALSQEQVRSIKVDLGIMTQDYWDNYAQNYSITEYLALQFVEEDREKEPQEPQDIIIYGFGRIGRLLTRLLVEPSSLSCAMRLRAVVVRDKNYAQLTQRLNLFKHDSVHGTFKGWVQCVEQEGMALINGHRIQFILADHPSDIDYKKYGIDKALVIDSTGQWRDIKGLSQHLMSHGVAKVLQTSPAQDDMKQIVYGVNDHLVETSDTVVSAASCTTNAIAPILYLIQKQYGITSGHIESVHAYTSDQNLTDNLHKKDRRGRSAVLNMVMTSTGAAQAIEKSIPTLEGKLTASAIRVPIANVSLAVIQLHLAQPTTHNELNQYITYCRRYTKWSECIDIRDTHDLVSSDCLGARHAAIFDMRATQVLKQHVVLYVWYDNEYGYSCQTLKVAQCMLDCESALFPLAARYLPD